MRLPIFLNVSVWLLLAATLHGQGVSETWTKRAAGAAGTRDVSHAVAVNASGNVLVGGYVNDGGASNADFYVAKYAGDTGALLWEKIYNGSQNKDDYVCAVAFDPAGNAVVTGESQGDFYTAKYTSANGTLIWEQRLTGPGGFNHSNQPRAMAVDSVGNVVVTGASINVGGQDEYLTVKYASANGALVWEKRYHGTAGGFDAANAVAVDTAGNVIVTGTSLGSGEYNPDIYTAKYAAANGALLWEKRFDSPEMREDVGQAVALDASGNVVVTGRSDDVNDLSDGYTAKYASADGALLWERYFRGVANNLDSLCSLALDSSGNAIVGGSSYNSSGDSDGYVAKYLAANGALVWEKFYNGPGGGLDEVSAVTVDTQGNAFATGQSYGGTLFLSDFYTVKYAAATGATLWQKRYNAPDSKNDGPGIFRSIARGPNFVVVTGFSNTATSTDSGDCLTIKYVESGNAPISDWKLTNLGDANAGDLEDPDGDGLATLFEYGLCLAPQSGSAANVPHLSIVDEFEDGRFLRLFFTRDPARMDVTIQVQGASSVSGPWMELATSVLGGPVYGPGYVSGESVGSSLKTIEVHDTVNIDGTSKRFLRILVSH